MSNASTLTALVLRRWDQGESDRRLSVLTRERGRLNVVAKGARKGGSRLAGCSEPLTVSMMQLAEGKRQGFITQAQPVTSFGGLRADYDRLLFALAHAELVSAVSPLENPQEELFEATLLTLKAIETHERPEVAAVWGQVQLMSHEGILPTWTLCTLDGSALNENPAWASPMAGGYVSPSHANEFSDRFLVTAETLIALEKMATLDFPPPRFKGAIEALRALSRFWSHHAGRDLPANEALLQTLQMDRA